MRTGEDARFVVAGHGTESGVYTANEELARDAASSVNFREQTVIGGGYAPTAYL